MYNEVDMSEAVEIVKKFCKKCKIEKIENIDFYFRSDRNKYRATCKDCTDLVRCKSKSKTRKNKVSKLSKSKDIIENNIIKRQCKKCNIIQILCEENYHFVKLTQSFRDVCKICEYKRKAAHYLENQEKYLNMRADYVQNNKPTVRKSQKNIELNLKIK